MSLIDRERLRIVDLEEQASRATGRVSEDLRRAGEVGAFAATVLGARGSGRVLLLGCGTAAEAPALAAGGARVIAVDVARPLLLDALKRGGRVSTVEGSAYRFPFAAQSFDGVVEFHGAFGLTAESDEEALEALKALRWLLRMGGRYLCGTPEPCRVSSSARASPDRRRIDESRLERGGIEHRTLRLARPDGTWLRLHDRRRWRDYPAADRVLQAAGFVVINAFRGYRRDQIDAAPGLARILLCEAR